MAITSSEIIYRLSGGSSNTDPAASIGGEKSSTAVTSSTIFDAVDAAESAAGDVEYRCIYVHNANSALSLQSAVIWLSANTSSSSTDIAIGVGTSGINGTETAVANESTAPSSVTFSSPSTSGTGLSLGTIPAGQHIAVWVRRTITAGAAASSDTATLTVQGATAA